MQYEWNESVPTKDTEARDIDVKIRDFKRAIRERLEHEHAFYDDENGHTDVGEHKTGSARVDFGHSDNKPENNSDNPGLFYYETNTGEIKIDNGTEWLEYQHLLDVEDKIDTYEAFPVGALYLSVQSTDPSESLGYGEWERFAKGRMLIGVDEDDGDFSSAYDTGGTKQVQLSVSEMPSHRHRIEDISFTSGRASGSLDTSRIDYDAGDYKDTDFRGGDESHENMPPYMAVYIWRRVS